MKTIAEDFWAGGSIAGWVVVLVAEVGFQCNFPFLNNNIFHATYHLIVSLPISSLCSRRRRELANT